LDPNKFFGGKKLPTCTWIYLYLLREDIKDAVGLNFQFGKYTP